MSKTSCQDGLRYVYKEVSLHEKEQIVKSFVPMFEQTPPSYRDKLNHWEKGSAVERHDFDGYAFEMAL
jgi:hypothetical protein